MTEHLKLTVGELEALKWLLVEEAQRRDDDGNDGAFERSPLAAVYRKVKACESAMAVRPKRPASAGGT